MYTISHGPSQIVQKSRRGHAQKLDGPDFPTIPNPKPTSNVGAIAMGKGQPSARGKMGPRGPTQYHSHSSAGGDSQDRNSQNGHTHGHPVNGNSHNSQNYTPRNFHQRNSPEDESTQQQEDLVRFIYERWLLVQKELDEASSSSCSNGTKSSSSIVYYKETEPNQSLRNFEPFDLESWWGQQLYRKLTQS